jgi:hypothetical protein
MRGTNLNNDNMTSPTNAGNSYLNKSGHKSHYENLNSSISPANNTNSFISGQRNGGVSLMNGGSNTARGVDSNNGMASSNLDSSYEAHYAPA